MLIYLSCLARFQWLLSYLLFKHITLIRLLACLFFLLNDHLHSQLCALVRLKFKVAVESEQPSAYLLLRHSHSYHLPRSPPGTTWSYAAFVRSPWTAHPRMKSPQRRDKLPENHQWIARLNLHFRLKPALLALIIIKVPQARSALLLTAPLVLVVALSLLSPYLTPPFAAPLLPAPSGIPLAERGWLWN